MLVVVEELPLVWPYEVSLWRASGTRYQGGNLGVLPGEQDELHPILDGDPCCVAIDDNVYDAEI